jgi:tetratricopeptide (TPR) repeat protein
MMKLNKSIILLVALTAMLFSSCREHHVAQRHVAVDSLINIAYQARNYDSILSLADLHQQEGTLSNIEACYWRGYAYSRLRKIRMAEIEWKRAVAQTIETDEDLIYYAQSANRLTGLLYLKAEYGEAIQVALPAIRLLKEKGYTMNNDYFNLLTFIGSCELKLDQPEGAANNFTQVWQAYQQITKTVHSINSYTSSIVGLVTIVDAYIQTGYYS